MQWQDVLKFFLYRKGTSFRLSVINNTRSNEVLIFGLDIPYPLIRDKRFCTLFPVLCGLNRVPLVFPSNIL